METGEKSVLLEDDFSLIVYFDESGGHKVCDICLWIDRKESASLFVFSFFSFALLIVLCVQS